MGLRLKGEVKFHDIRMISSGHNCTFNPDVFKLGIVTMGCFLANLFESYNSIRVFIMPRKIDRAKSTRAKTDYFLKISFTKVDDGRIPLTLFKILQIVYLGLPCLPPAHAHLLFETVWALRTAIITFI
jgi:hypothetical protein